LTKTKRGRMNRTTRREGKNPGRRENKGRGRQIGKAWGESNKEELTGGQGGDTSNKRDEKRPILRGGRGTLERKVRGELKTRGGTRGRRGKPKVKREKDWGGRTTRPAAQKRVGKREQVVHSFDLQDVSKWEKRPNKEISLGWEGKIDEKG